MKIKNSLCPSLQQGVFAVILFVTGMIISLLGIHLDSSIDSTQESLFFFGAILPVLTPPCLFEESKANLFILIFGLYGACLLGLWAKPTNYYVLNMTHVKIMDIPLQLLIGIIGVQVINISACPSKAKKTTGSQNEVEEDIPRLA